MKRYTLLLFLSLCPLSAVYAQSIPADSLPDTMAMQRLGAVTVSARRPMLQHKEGKLIVNVDRTVLADAGSMHNLLQRTPGLQVDADDNISVFGKGTPIIYINDKEMVSSEELKALQSTDIDRIEIDRNPSARYSAAGEAIVHIYTKHGMMNHTNVLLYDDLSFSRKTGNTVGAQLDFKNDRWANLLSYSFSDENSLDYDSLYQTNTLPAYTIQKNGYRTSHYRSGQHRIFSGNEYSFDARNKLDLQFSGVWSSNDYRVVTRQSIRKTNMAELFQNIDDRAQDGSALYNTNLSYRYNPDSVDNFSITLAYARQSAPSDEEYIDETNLGSDFTTSSQIESRSANDIYSAQADGGFRLLRFIDLSLGAKYAQVVTDGYSRQWNTATGITDYAQHSRIDDRIAAGYVELRKTIGDFSLRGGVRYEHTSSHTTSNGAKIDTAYHGFFPSLSLGYARKPWSVNLSYTRRIRRPAFDDIDPTVSYMDSLEYRQGNPFLRPAYSDNVELNVAFHDFNLTLDYSHTRDAITESAENDPANPDITRWTNLNLSRMHDFSFGLTYAHTWGLYTGSYEVQCDFPYSEFPYLGKNIVRNKPNWYFCITNTFNITDNFSLTCEFQRLSVVEYGITSNLKPRIDLSAGAQWKLFDNRLVLSLTCEDILHSYHDGTWEERYGNLISGCFGNRDTRYVQVGIRWNFNKIHSGVKQNRSNADELNRL